MAVGLLFVAVFMFTYLSFERPQDRAPSPSSEATQSDVSSHQSQPSREAEEEVEPAAVAAGFSCQQPEVIDGDTLRCGTTRVRLVGIDAPEMPGHCRMSRRCVEGDPFASKAKLEQLIAANDVQCVQTDMDRYGRVVASCTSGGENLSCALVRANMAVIRYGGYPCQNFDEVRRRNRPSEHTND